MSRLDDMLFTRSLAYTYTYTHGHARVRLCHLMRERASVAARTFVSMHRLCLLFAAAANRMTEF